MSYEDHSRAAFLEERSRTKGRKRAALLSVALVGALAVGGTMAFLSTQSGTVENAFVPGTVACEVVESFKDGDAEKKDVYVQNTGDVDAYVRAAISASWVKAETDTLGTKGDVHGSMLVKGEDYTLATGSDWKLHSDGLYYYKGEVAGGASTTNLVVSCAPVAGKAPDGYVLQVDVIASAVQADGVDAKGNRAVELAWNVDFDDSGVIAATVAE